MRIRHADEQTEQCICLWDEGGLESIWKPAQLLYYIFQVSLLWYPQHQDAMLTQGSIGYIVMLYISCFVVSHIGPSVWLPGCEVMWGIVTCCLSTVTKDTQVYGLRFLVGFFEGCAWPGYFTIISAWYLPHEMALRMSLYNIAGPVGAMLSGALQGALSTNLDGSLGRSGWRWAFIINGTFYLLFRGFRTVSVPHLLT